MTSQPQADIGSLLEHLFAQHQQEILNYLYRLVGELPLAEELTQDTFVKAYAALCRRRLPDDANWRAWLYRIATNTAYDHLRRRRLVQWLPLLERDRASSEPNGWESAVGQHDAVQRALAELSDGDRAVLILHSVQGYSTLEISDMLGISLGATKTRLCRARERFRRVYGERS